MAHPRRKKTDLPGFQELLEQDLKTRKYRPVYVLAGEDSHRAEAVVEQIRKDALGESGSAFNYHVFQGDQTPFARVLQQALSLPMLGSLQVVWVKHAEGLVATTDGQTAMEKYLAGPVEETILVLTMERADKRKKWVKLCQEQGFLFDFAPPAGEALVQWVLKAAAREGLPLGHEQARILCDLVGNDLHSLRSEITKLALLAEDRGEAPTSEEIGRLIMDQAALEGYEITANLEPGRTADVLRTWYRLAEWGRSPYEIAPLILSRVRRGTLLARCRDRGMDDREIGALTGQNPWSFRYLEPMIRGLGPRGLARALRASLDCDRRMKSSPLKPDIIIENTIMEVCRHDDDDR
jgi:DNA polymerase III delta subunit